jgi:hypothetical protein
MKAWLKILLCGLGLFVVGTIATDEGWTIHRQSVPGHDVPNFSALLIDAIGRLGPLLVGSDSDLGQRLGALGIILAAIGLVTAAFATWALLREASERMR